jgi:hypothetical protein
MHHPSRGHRIVPTETAPLDGFTQPSGAYSFRRLRSAYTGPAVRLRRASDNLETDINFLGFTGFTGAPWDSAAAVAHCAATTCFGRWWYDQSGNARDIGQLTAASQPQLIFNCTGSLPCWRITTTGQRLDGASFTPVSPVSLSAVGKRTGTAANGFWIGVGLNPANRMLSTTANTWASAGSTGIVNQGAADGAWHSGVAVLQGAGSVFGLNGSELTGSVTVQTGAGIATLFGLTGNTTDYAEAIWWSGYGLTAGERAALNANQRSFWGTP